MRNISEKERRLIELDILRAFYFYTGIPKDERLDNTVYYPVYSSNKRYNLIYGGRGSGKSFEIEGKLPIVLITCLPFCRVMMIRQIYNSIKGSQFQEVCDYIDKWDLYNYFDIYKSPMRIVHKQSENYISFAGMDKPQSLKSMKDFTHVIFGEAFQIDDDEGVSIVDKSIRTPRLELDNHKLFFVFNPDNKNHPLYRKFYDDSFESLEKYSSFREKAFILKTTYKDNKFVPQSFIDLIESDKKANPERYLVDGLGEWGDLKKHGLYYSNFDYNSVMEEGLKDRVYDKTKPIIITFDFNVYPYITAEVKQLYYNEQDHTLEVCNIEEICLTDEARIGNIEETCKEFLKRFSSHVGNVIVTGDRSGHNKKTNAKSDYATIFLTLSFTPLSKYIQVRDSKTDKMVSVNPNPYYEKYGCSFKLIDQTIKTNNPLHEVRKLFFRRLHAGMMIVLPLSKKHGTINSIGTERTLSKKYGGIKVVQKIDASCRFLLNDYLSVEEDTDSGTKVTRNPSLTHTSDAVDYAYATIFDAEFKSIELELKR